jgi:hypothetical protein
VILLAVPLGSLAAVLAGVDPGGGPLRPGRVPQFLRCSRVADRLLFTAVQFSVAALKRRAISATWQCAFLRTVVSGAWLSTFFKCRPSASCWIPHAAPRLVSWGHIDTAR